MVEILWHNIHHYIIVIILYNIIIIVMYSVMILRGLYLCITLSSDIFLFPSGIQPVEYMYVGSFLCTWLIAGGIFSLNTLGDLDYPW